MTAVKLFAAGMASLISVVIGVIVLFIMLIAMNGFSESDANWGFGAFILLTLLFSASLGFLAFIVCGALIKRGFKPFVSALIAVPMSSIVAVGLEVAASAAGIAIAEYVRVNY